MFGIGDDLANGAGFDDLAQVHHGHVVGDLGYHTQVVGDENDGHAQLIAKLAKKIKDLGLNGHIESGGGLVGDE